MAFDAFVPGVTGIQKAQHGDFPGNGHPVFHGAFQHAVAHELVFLVATEAGAAQGEPLGPGQIAPGVAGHYVHGHYVFLYGYVVPVFPEELGEVKVAAEARLFQGQGGHVPRPGEEHVVTLVGNAHEGDAAGLPEVLLPPLGRGGVAAEFLVIPFIIAVFVILGAVAVDGFYVFVVPPFQLDVVPGVLPFRPAEGDLLAVGFFIVAAYLMGPPVVFRVFVGVAVHPGLQGGLFFIQPGVGVGQGVVAFALGTDLPGYPGLVAGAQEVGILHGYGAEDPFRLAVAYPGP